MKDHNSYDEFIHNVYSLPEEPQGDLLRIAGHKSDNPLLYLWHEYCIDDSYHGYLVHKLFNVYNLVH